MGVVVTTAGAGRERAAPVDVLDACARLLDSACAPALRGSSTPGEMAPAVAWLLDHFGYLRLTIRETRDMLPRRFYRGLPDSSGVRRGRAARGRRHDAPRIRQLTADLVDRGVDRLDEAAIVSFFEEAQGTSALTLAELWAIAPMLRLALLERLHATLAAGDVGSPGGAAAVRAAITALRSLDKVRWREVTEAVCALDKVLRLDPSGVYARMDFETRDSYRRAVERVARASEAFDEQDAAALAVDLASQGDDERTRHVGYYLVGKGLRLLEERAGCRNPLRARAARAMRRGRGIAHLGGAALLTALTILVLARWLDPVPAWYLALMAVLASEAAIAVANGAAHTRVPPMRLPRLDFSDGIPDDCRTLVVVPALLVSTHTIEALLKRLEINYLANRDRNLLFALLTDVADSTEKTSEDEELGEACAEGIRRLNECYRAPSLASTPTPGERRRGPFYLFHRARTWNAAERAWMGHERKRGKLNALNAWLLGGPDPFAIKTGNLAELGSIRYVLTLDADTQVPLDAARTLVATAAHPLNRPVFDAATGVVRQGYAILQPRVSVSSHSASRSRLARIRSGATGVDPYATAVSDVYQDVYERASFTGKGLYDLAAYHRALDGRFPDNALLSHDLIEGEHARVGLVSDVELIDDYPRNYEVYSKRKHRWVRGDWQLLYWLLPRVPNGASAWVRNPLSALSRWKIFDNLRRSTLEISVALSLAGAWLLLPQRAPRATVAVAVLLLAGAYADTLFSLLRLPPARLLRGLVRERAASLGRAHVEMLISLGVMLHQALLMADAIARTLVRRLVTHRRLLEWETTAQAESASGNHPSLATRYLKITPAAAAALVLAAPAMRWHPAGLVLAALWLATPLLATWLSRPGGRRFAWGANDVTFLRGLALRTWRHFDERSDRAHHWLVPDTVQPAFARSECDELRCGVAATAPDDRPRSGGSELVAHQTSPTNIGLQLAATVAARDFGYLTTREMADTCSRVLDTIEGLERCCGHFYNWYDTGTLAALPPRYVSTVDSGNLSAALLAVKQGCLELRAKPIVGADTLSGLRDHAVRVRNSLPRALRRRAVARTVTSMLRRLEREPADAFAWWRLLAGLRPLAIAVHEWVRMAERRPRWRHPSDITEAGAWSARLVARIDEVGRDLRRHAPWIDSPDRDEMPAEIVEALGRVPAPADGDGHYEAIERQVRAALLVETPVAPLAGISWKQHARLRRQIAAARIAAVETDRALRHIADRCGRLAVEPDFAFLFDARQKLLRLGWNADTGEMDESSYDLLASEARTAVLLAIAKRDIPAKAWFHLGRRLASYGGERVLVSWGGTMFEHLMPSLFMTSPDDSLLGASARAMVRIQQAWGREHGVPWGVSESAHAAQEASGRYGYRTFGVPAAAMRRMSPDELVVAPHAAVLALMIDPRAAVDNIRLMAAKGWIGRYGLYESVDYSGDPSEKRRRGVVVRSFMAHHQGMSMLALCNAVLGGRVQRRFHAEPLVAAAERLLEERLPVRLPADELEANRAFEPIPERTRFRQTATPAPVAAEPAPLLTGASLLRLASTHAAPRARGRRLRGRVWRRFAERRVRSG